MSDHPATTALTINDSMSVPIDAELMFVSHAGRPCVLASQLSTVLGYERTDTISGLIAKEWAHVFQAGEHYDIVRGADMNTLRRAATAASAASAATAATAAANPISPKARHAIVLYEAGADLACAMSRQPDAAAWRARLAAKVNPAARRAALPAAVASPAAQAMMPTAVQPDRIDRMCAAIESMVGCISSLIPVLVQRAAAEPIAMLPQSVSGAEPTAPTAPAPVVAPPPAPAVQAAPPVEIPTSWISATTIAARLAVRHQRPFTAALVGRAINELGIRTRGLDVARCEILSRPVHGGERSIDVGHWLFVPTVVNEIGDYLATRPTSAERHAAGASAVLAAIVGDERPATRPGTPHRAA